jgi:hypothetical protein
MIAIFMILTCAAFVPVTGTVTAGKPYSTAGRECLGYLLAYSLNPAPGPLSLIWPATLPGIPDFEPSPFAIPTAVNGYVRSCIRFRPMYLRVRTETNHET